MDMEEIEAVKSLAEFQELLQANQNIEGDIEILDSIVDEEMEDKEIIKEIGDMVKSTEPDSEEELTKVSESDSQTSQDNQMGSRRERERQTLSGMGTELDRSRTPAPSIIIDEKAWRETKPDSKRSETRKSRIREVVHTSTRHSSRRSSETREVHRSEERTSHRTTSQLATKREQRHSEKQEHQRSDREILESGFISDGDFRALNIPVKPRKVVGRYYAQSDRKQNLVLCQWKNADGHLKTDWYFEFLVDKEMQIHFDAKYQRFQVPSWPLILSIRPLCDGVELLRNEEEETVGYIPEIPRTMRLSHQSRRSTNCHREHGFTILNAMIGKILLTSMLGETESIIPIKHFWNIIEPYMKLLTEVWEKYEAISRTDDPVKKSELEESSFNSLTEFLFRILKSSYAKKVDVNEFLKHTTKCCEEVQEFYADIEKRAGEARPNVEAQRAKTFGKESNHNYLLQMRTEEDERREKQKQQAEAMQLELANPEEFGRRQREAHRHWTADQT